MTGPFGAGKDTLTSKVMEYGGATCGIEQPVRYTSRDIRANEKNGREYCFLSRKEFEKMATSDEFLLWGDLTSNYYGTSSKSLQDVFDRGKIPLMIQGITEIGPMRKALSDRKIPYLEIFISPISKEELSAPGEIDKALEILAKRMNIAGRNKIEERLELSRAMFKGISEDTIVIPNSNGNLDNAVLDFLKVIASKKAELNALKANKHPAMVEFEETGKINDEFFKLHNLNAKGRLAIIISGPSGAGKGTILEQAFKDKDLNLGKAISYTTRKKRNNETHGVEYFFIPQGEFEKKILSDDMFEWLMVVNGNYYGHSEKQIQGIFDDGKDGIFDIDIKGTKYYQYLFQRMGVPYIDIFISPVSKDILSEPDGLEKAKTILRERLINRGSGETSEQIEDRVNKAAEYLTNANTFTHIIENPDGGLEKATQEFIKTLKEKTFKPESS